MLIEELKPIPKGATIIQTPEFTKLFKKLKLTDDDLRDLETSLGTYPPDASLGGKLYKFRWSPKKFGRGQSNGTRVIYALIDNNEVYLVTIYTHNQQDNISVNKLNSMKKVVKEL